MNNVSLAGGVSMTQFGLPNVYLMPRPGETARDFKRLESEELERVICDHYNFFRSGEVTGKVHGRTVTVGRTKREGRKIMNFSAGFLDMTLLENLKAEDDTKVILFIELPFHDPAAARRADTGGGGG